MRPEAAIRVSNPRGTFTFAFRSAPGRIELQIHQFSLRRFIYSIVWLCVFIICLAAALRFIPQGINFVVAALCGALCLVPLLYLNGSLYRSLISFESHLIKVRVRRLATFHSAEGAPDSLELLGSDYRSHGEPGFAIRLGNTKLQLSNRPSLVDVTALLEQLLEHARTQKHPAFDFIRYDRERSTIYSSLAPGRNY